MIRLMGEDFKKALKDSGYIIIMPFEGCPAQSCKQLFTERLHRIMYTGSEFCSSQKLFNCIVTLTNKFMSVKNVYISKESIFTNISNKARLKSSVYAWLDLSLDALELFGSVRKKVKISISSNLPGIANLFMEKGYRRIHQNSDKKMEFSNLFDEVRNTSKYVGLKDL